MSAPRSRTMLWFAIAWAAYMAIVALGHSADLERRIERLERAGK